jgi:hypothetical protein
METHPLTLRRKERAERKVSGLQEESTGRPDASVERGGERIEEQRRQREPHPG